MTEATEPKDWDRIERGLLAQALVALQLDLPTIAKTETAKVTSEKGSYSYSYAGLATVASAIYPKLAQHSLSFTSFPTLNEAGRFVLRYTLMHASGASRSGDFPLANDFKTPQAMGSAITYARRYALCAVTGVAPEDDDGQAAAYSQQQDTAPPAVDNETAQAINGLIGVWQVQYGPWTPAAQAEAGAEFKLWSKGEEIRSASPARLRAFTAYISTLNPKDAGGPPPAAQDQRYRNPDAELSEAQRVRILAGLTEIGIKERQARLSWMTRELGRTVASTNDLTMAEAGQLIEALNKGVDVPGEPA